MSEPIEVLRESLNKVGGYGRSDMGHQEMCDYVTEVAEEGLEALRKLEAEIETLKQSRAAVVAQEQTVRNELNQARGLLREIWEWTNKDSNELEGSFAYFAEELGPKLAKFMGEKAKCYLCGGEDPDCGFTKD